jgi:hypothetical protein
MKSPRTTCVALAALACTGTVVHAQVTDHFGVPRASSYASARADPAFLAEIARVGDATPEELADRIGVALADGSANRTFWARLAFRETLDCAGACVSFTPYSTTVNVIELHLRGNDVQDITAVTLLLRDPLGLDRLERRFGTSPSSSCRSMAADTASLECDFAQSRSGPAGKVTLHRAAMRPAPDAVTELSLQFTPAPPSTKDGQHSPLAATRTGPGSTPSVTFVAILLLAALTLSVAASSWPMRARGLSYLGNVLPRIAGNVIGCSVSGAFGAGVSYFILHRLSGESLAGAVFPIVMGVTGAAIGIIASIAEVPLLAFGHGRLGRFVGLGSIVLAALQLEVLIRLHLVR